MKAQCFFFFHFCPLTLLVLWPKVNCIPYRKTLLARTLRVPCVYGFNSVVHAQYYVALESCVFFWFNKISDNRFWRPNVFSFFFNFVLWLSWICGLRINCLLYRKTLLARILRVLCVYGFNSVVHAQYFMALESYVFFCLINSRIISFEGPMFFSFFFNFVLWLSWFSGLRINCLLHRKTLFARILGVNCVYEFNSIVHSQDFFWP